MKRSRNAVLLRIIRSWVGQQQRDIAERLLVDQSTVSRAESGEIELSGDFERFYIEACGGLDVLRTLIDHLQGLLERLGNHNHLMPA